MRSGLLAGLLLLLLLLFPWKFFISTLADGLSLKFEWQQISSSLHDFSQYSGQSPWYSSLDGLHSSSFFPSPPVPLIIFWWLFQAHQFPIFLNSQVRSRYVSFFSLSFNFTMWCVHPGQQSPQFIKFSFFFSLFFFFCCSTQNGSALKLVDKFTYLGSCVSSTETDIDTRLAKARTASDRLSVIWKSDLTDKIKPSFSQAAVVSIRLYGCTTWTLTKRMEKELDGN